MQQPASTNRATLEATQYLHAILLLIQNKPEGIQIIARSGLNITRSFIAYLWCLPAQLFIWSLIWRRNEISETTSRIEFLITVSIIDMLVWVLFATAIYVTMQLTSAKKLAAPMIVTSNWFNLFASYVFFIPAMMNYTLQLSEGTTSILEFMLYFTVVGLYFRIARHILGNNSLFAFALTLISVVITVFASNVAFTMISN